MHKEQKLIDAVLDQKFTPITILSSYLPNEVNL